MADREEHCLKTPEFYVMEVHVVEFILREVFIIGIHLMECQFTRGEVDGGLHHDKTLDLCGVSYRQADTQRDELTRCSIRFC
jgi:hypothetical protein